MAVEPLSKPRFTAANRMPIPEEIARYCSSLVSLSDGSSVPLSDGGFFSASDENDGFDHDQVFQLAHFSVQEYLQSDRLEPAMAKHFDKATAAAAMVDLCLSYLLALDPLLPLGETEEKYPFAEFCAQYWSDYAEAVESSNHGVLEIMKEYYNSQETFTLACQLYAPDYRSGVKKTITPLYYASFVGLPESVHMLLKTETNVDDRTGRFGNALQAASYRGHETIAKMLFQSGANVNTQGGLYGNALEAASSEGHEGIVKMLLQKCANLNTEGCEEDASAFKAACRNGHLGIVKMLLDKGADVNAKGYEWLEGYGGALQVASRNGHQGIVEMLLEKGADVNAKGFGEYGEDVGDGTALDCALAGGHERIIHVLIRHGAKIPRGYNSNSTLFGSVFRRRQR